MKHLKVLLLSPLSERATGITNWTKHILAYYDSLLIDKKIDFEFSFFSMARRHFITAATSLPYKIKEGVIDYVTLLRKYRKVVKEENPSVVHIVSSAYLGLIKDLMIEMINRKRGIKTIIHFRFGRIPELAKIKNWEWKLLKGVVSRADKVIVIDTTSYRVLKEMGWENIAYLPNPVAPQILNLVAENTSVQREERKIVFAGHMLPTKGIFELLKATAQIPDIRLIMMGRLISGVKEELLSIATTKGDTNWINILGQQEMETVIKEMLSSAVFVLPTYTEGFPNAILESMACGCAIVTTPVGAIPEMLNISDSDQVCGTCVEVKNVDALKVAIERYLNDRKLAETHGHIARERVLHEYNISGIWNQMVEIWKETNESEM